MNNILLKSFKDGSDMMCNTPIQKETVQSILKQFREDLQEKYPTAEQMWELETYILRYIEKRDKRIEETGR